MRDNMYLIYATLLAALTFNFQQTIAFDISFHLGTKSPYIARHYGNEQRNNHKDSLVPPECEVEHFQLIARHGARYPTDNDIESLNSLRHEIQLYFKNKLLNKEYEWLSDWNHPFNEYNSGLLINRGEDEHYDLAKRLIARFPSVFSEPYDPNTYDIQTTAISRTAQSANVFGFSIFGEGKGTIGKTNFRPFSTWSNSRVEDIQLRFFENCPNFEIEQMKEVGKLEAENYLKMKLPRIVSGIYNQIVPVHHPYHPEFITPTMANRLFTACAFDIVTKNRTDLFCSIFGSDSIKIFEYASDLKMYWELGYGTPINYKMACSLFTEISKLMQEKISTFYDSSSSQRMSKLRGRQRAKFRFAHAETLIPLVSLLGLYNDTFTLRWNSSEDEISSRKWKTSEISPFAGNIAFILYRCTDNNQTEWKVRVLHNEIDKPFSHCNNQILCPYDLFFSKFQNYLNCNFREICSNHRCGHSGNDEEKSLFPNFGVGENFPEKKQSVPQNVQLKHFLYEDPILSSNDSTCGNHFWQSFSDYQFWLILTLAVVVGIIITVIPAVIYVNITLGREQGQFEEIEAASSLSEEDGQQLI